MKSPKLWLALGMVFLSTSNCKTTKSSDLKTNIFSVGEIPTNVTVGHGFNINDAAFLQNCTNIDPRANGTIKEVQLQVERSRLQENYDANSNSHSGDVAISLDKHSGSAGGSTSASNKSRRAVIDEEIYIKRRVHTIKGNFIGKVGIVDAFSASQAFNSNCGSEYVDEVAYGGALSISMDLNSSEGEISNEVHSKVSTDPIGFLSNVAIEASQNSEWASKYKNYSISLRLNSNQTLECLSSSEAQVQSCNLTTADGCNLMSQKIEACKEEFRTKVLAQDPNSFTTPITVGTTPYPADNAMAQYWQSQVNDLEKYLSALNSHKGFVDTWQDQAILDVTRLLASLNGVLVQCVYRSATIQEESQAVGSPCDRFIEPLKKIKSTEAFERYVKIKPDEVGLKGVIQSSGQKNAEQRGTNYHSFEFIQAPNKAVEISVDQRNDGRFDVLVQRTNMDDDVQSIQAQHNPIFAKDQVIKIPAANSKQKIKIFPKHRVYSWSRAKIIERRSVCVLNDDKMSADCDNRFTGGFDHISIRLKVTNP